jgi:hypothetical protein
MKVIERFVQFLHLPKGKTAMLGPLIRSGRTFPPAGPLVDNPGCSGFRLMGHVRADAAVKGIQVRTRVIQFSAEWLTDGYIGAIKRFDPSGGAPASSSPTRAKTLLRSCSNGITTTPVDRGFGGDSGLPEQPWQAPRARCNPGVGL